MCFPTSHPENYSKSTKSPNYCTDLQPLASVIETLKSAYLQVMQASQQTHEKDSGLDANVDQLSVPEVEREIHQPLVTRQGEDVEACVGLSESVEPVYTKSSEDTRLSPNDVSRVDESMEEPKSGSKRKRRPSKRDSLHGSPKRRRTSRRRPFGVTRQNHERVYVNHSYHDYTGLADDNKDGVFVEKDKRGGTTLPFPNVLHRILDQASTDGYGEIISWQPHGRSFHVHDQERFVSEVMPNYFRQTRFSSFQRQLSLYGFLRLTRKGLDQGAYYHELFLRGMPHLCRNMHRTRIKGYWVRQSSSPNTEPDFYHIPPVGEELSERMYPSTATKVTDQQETPPQEIKPPLMLQSPFAALQPADTWDADPSPAVNRTELLLPMPPMPPLEAYRKGGAATFKMGDVDRMVTKADIQPPVLGAGLDIAIDDQEALAAFLCDVDLDADCGIKESGYEGEDTLAEIYDHVTQI
jgi:hypothetical protein